MSSASGERPGIRATTFVRRGADSKITEGMPTSSSSSATYSAAGRSPDPGLVVSILIRSEHIRATSLILPVPRLLAHRCLLLAAGVPQPQRRHLGRRKAEDDPVEGELRLQRGDHGLLPAPTVLFPGEGQVCPRRAVPRQ